MAVLDPSTSPVLAPATAPKKPSVFEDFIDIFYAPRQVFERRREGEFFAALVVVTLLTGLLVFVLWNLLEPAFSAQTDRAVAKLLEKNPRMNEQQIAGMRGFMEKSQAFGFVVGMPIAALLGAIGIWIVGKFFDAKQTFGQAMTVSTYSLFPIVLAFLAMGVMGLLVPSGSVEGLHSLTLSPARFLDADTTPPALLTTLMRIEPFSLWGAYITGVGIAVTGGISRGRGLAAAAVVWLLGTLVQAGAAAMQ